MEPWRFFGSRKLWSALLATLFHVCFASDNSSIQRKLPVAAHKSPENAYYPLLVSVYEVSEDSVEMDWTFNRGEQWSLKACELVYGPLRDLSRLEVLSNFLPDNHSFRIPGLALNTSYHCHLVCYSQQGARLQSNTLTFTTGATSPSSPLHFVSSDSFRGYETSYSSPSAAGGSSLSQRERGGGDQDSRSSSIHQSSGVVLGAVCGIVGFLIINVTVVMVVRRYSQRQVRRRRILHLQEEREYDDFPYLRGFE